MISTKSIYSCKILERFFDKSLTEKGNSIMETEYYASFDTSAKKYLTNQVSTDYTELKNDEVVQIVEVSKELYDFIKSQADSSDRYVDLSNYNPTIPKLPFVNLKINAEKLKKSNERWEELKQEDPERFKGDDFSNSMFQPWKLVNSENFTELILEEDDPDLDTTGIYLEFLNARHHIERLTDYETVNPMGNKYLYIVNQYGVADNATQVMRRLEQSLKDYLFGNDLEEEFYLGKSLVKFMELYPEYKLVLLMTPYVNTKDCSWGGWRWHKWGEYIGVHEPQHEYLSCEQGIDYVLSYDLEIVKKIEEETNEI